MKTISKIFCVLLGILTLQSTTLADILTMKDGKKMEGTFVKSDGKTVDFKTDFGNVSVDKGKIASITFGNAAAPATQATPPAAAAAPQAATTASSGPVTLPTGTVLIVQTVGTVSSKTAAGSSYKTVLAYDLTQNGQVVAKAGTVIMGKVVASQQARRVKGKSMLDIRLEKINLDGKSVAIATSGYKAATQDSLAKAAKGAAAGAAIGAIAGDAGKGAAIGAAAGGLRKGDTITVDSGTLLEFTLTKPATL